MLHVHEGHDRHDHAMSEPDKEALADFIRRQESVTLTTVGIDIGTST
ncbi:MAG: hypothetical protein GTO60_03420, partial [Gammaproteobacteria bacterium]|nr:hypothetical protein [Gammaproteobacteria bacterium]